MSFMVFLAMLQGAPELHVSVDEDHVTVGEEIVYTIQAVSHSSDPMDLTVAPLNGFEIISRSERTEVSFSSGPTRTTVLEMRLRAVQARPLADRPCSSGSGPSGHRGCGHRGGRATQSRCGCARA